MHPYIHTHMPAYIQHTLTPPQIKQYTLPRHPTTKPFSKPPSKLAPGATTTPTSSTTTPPSTTTTTTTTTITVKLISPRNPPFELSLPAQPPNTSLAEIKEQAARETGLPLAKIKLLCGKKPVGDSKLLRELLVNGGEEEGGLLELGVMVLGGAAGFSLKKKEVAVVEEAVVEGEGDKMQGVEGAAAAAAAADGAPVAQGLSGEGVLATGEFWEDLRGFLQQRVRDEAVAGEALGVFKGAWEGRSA
jgi:hypothetical protein